MKSKTILLVRFWFGFVSIWDGPRSWAAALGRGPGPAQDHHEPAQGHPEPAQRHLGYGWLWAMTLNHGPGPWHMTTHVISLA